MTLSDRATVTNRILAALPEEEYNRLTQGAVRIHKDVGGALYESGEPIRDMYFLLDGIGSVVTSMTDGTSIETLIVGREGVTGLSALDPENTSLPTNAFMQVAGDVIKINAAAVRQEFHRAGRLQLLLLRYLQFTVVQISQSAACNRLHNLEERMARWLLMSQDRLEKDSFAITHEFLAQMLGTRRSSVTLAAGTLQRAGVIDYHRGQMHLLNREGLEDIACECYRVIKASWDKLVLTQ